MQSHAHTDTRGHASRRSTLYWCCSFVVSCVSCSPCLCVSIPPFPVSFVSCLCLFLIFQGTTFVDHLLRYEANPDVKILVVLGEVGGIEEYEICELIKSGRLTKPMVAWCIGTCAKIFPYEVQFGKEMT